MSGSFVWFLTLKVTAQRFKVLLWLSVILHHGIRYLWRCVHVKNDDTRPVDFCRSQSNRRTRFQGLTSGKGANSYSSLRFIFAHKSVGVSPALAGLRGSPACFAPSNCAVL